MLWIMWDDDLELAVDPAPERTEQEDPWLRCRHCDAEVTPQAARIEVEGSHDHYQVNPAGYPFFFGCFAEAPGCLLAGLATEEHSWFAGHAWRLAHCRSCGEHLGWYFRSPSGSGFYGLILNRLAG